MELKNWECGMDIQYGATLDATLNATMVNLKFQQVFNEQRQFFIEGTELFNKAELFFSRRIGGTPTK